MQSKLKPNVAAPALIAVTYVLLLLSRLFGFTSKGGGNEYLGIIVLQLLIFLLPAVIYCKLRGERFITSLRLRFFGAEQLVLVIISTALLICGSLILNIIMADGVSQESFSLYQTFTASHNGTAESFLYVTLAYAALPAFCEEFLFRAVLTAEYERYGLVCAAVMTSLFFAMLHFNFAQLIIYMFAGCVLYVTLLATRSFFGAVAEHFLFNMYGLFGQNFANEIYKTTGSTELFMVILITVFLLLLTIFSGEASRIYRYYAKRNIPSYYRVKPRRGETGQNLVEALFAPPSLVCYVLFVIITAIS